MLLGGVTFTTHVQLNNNIHDVDESVEPTVQRPAAGRYDHGDEPCAAAAHENRLRPSTGRGRLRRARDDVDNNISGPERVKTQSSAAQWPR